MKKKKTTEEPAVEERTVEDVAPEQATAVEDATAVEEFVEEATAVEEPTLETAAPEEAALDGAPGAPAEAVDGAPVEAVDGAPAEAVDGAPAEAGAVEEEAPPPVDSAARLESIVESLLFASDRPLGLGDLKRLLGERDAKKVTAALDALKARHADTGVQLASVAGGFQFRTHPANGAWVSKLVAGRPQRLSRALLETLAIVAYRQPVTRPEIDEIRGVDCGPVLKTLLDRGLVRMIGKKEDVGRPILYGTTPEFLRTFSLRDLNELPTLREFHELSAAQQAEVDAQTEPSADGDGAAAAAAPAAVPAPQMPAPRPAPGDLGELADDEEDTLLADLERASAAAEAATTTPEAPDAT